MARKRKAAAADAEAGAGNGAEAESKHSRFLRLAVPRMNRARKAIQLIGNLAAGGYESTAQERDQIVTALTEATADVKRKLENVSKAGEGFAFK